MEDIKVESEFLIEVKKEDEGLVLKDEIKEEPVDVEPSEESVTVYIKKENNISLYDNTENDKVIMAKQDELENEGGNSNSHGDGCNGILRDILTNCKTRGLETEESSVNPSVTFEDNVHENDDIEEGPCVPQKTFRINMSAIQSVSKENQAMELQSLEGLSVYDQGTLEAGILHQVDQALDETVESTDMLESTGESSMERQIRLGEMTPFGSTLDTAATTARNQKSGLREIEEYFEKQMELQGMVKQRMNKRKPQAESKLKDSENLKKKQKENKHDLLKRKLLNREGKTKKKRKKEELGTETKDFFPWSEKPDPVASETASVDFEDPSGSEYQPSESDCESSSAEAQQTIAEEKEGKPTLKRKKKSSKSRKPYKIPEDWASDDSDWEYSDEEGNIKRNKRTKKELDDGDVDAFNRRIRLWEREKQKECVEEKYHQLDGGYKLPLNMWDKLYNYQRVGVRWLWELDRQRCGGILGDEMGLGKTIQVIAFLAGLHVSELKDKDTGFRGLGPTLIVCPTTVMHQWVKEFHQWFPPLRVAILHESGTFTGKQRSRLIANMVQFSGVLITSYTGVTQHKEDIITRRWHYVILDEGHKIRNPDAQVTLVVKQLKTSHRIILSGSPMQNNLKELWSLFDFVFPGKLGTLPVFLEQFAVPITQGGYANASQVQVMTAFKCATVLKDTIAPYLLRRMKADVKCHVNLPEKNEQVLFCRLTEEQRNLYKNYVESGEVSRILEGRLKIFMGLITLRKICNHPDLYSGGPKLYPGETVESLPEEERYGHWKKSGKMAVVETLLRLWNRQGHRVLVFTQSRQMLAIMEVFVEKAGYKYLKLDGGTSIAARQPLINKFNQDTSYFVMLLTTRVGGLGVNLTGANRVLIYDPDWNPATDTQARERAWRIGQQQSVTVYRLITAGTIEEKMYHRQIFKQFLCNKVLKDPRQRRFFKSNDLYELFTLKETDVEGSTETAAIFAGTNSEVKLDPNKTYRCRKVEPRLNAQPPAETYSKKKAEKKKKAEEQLKKTREDPSSDVCFSDEKIERMKKLAQMLSQKIVKNSTPEKNHPSKMVEKQELLQEEKNDMVLISDEELSNSKSDASRIKFDITEPSTSCFSESLDTSLNHKKHGHKSKHKDKKKRRLKDAKFEGETVPHLVKTSVAKSTEAEENEDGKSYATQDEYVLKKLFSNSGLQTAMQHDTIMEGGPADYALVEGEADRVAKQAVEKLRESQRECWRPTSGIPTFTGVNGARNFQPTKRFGKGTGVETMSSRELIEHIKKRNCAMDAKDADLELVRDIREFVSSQGGTVNTNQIINRFEGRLPEGSSPLFKSLLSKICTFYRAPDKLGYWTLKEEFNW
ncbi:DNA excision repair protein ERCC-6-like [Homalodisca vitripennis]|uniref:DNA excision repair protein ERCC-6-like n=1 Tax=Homalodisca vitripennis TaxID=197043 RepID=UPI001EEC8539|nr:DNA excision repair protein ERCC-6-like [Homalodisca vitripennis]